MLTGLPPFYTSGSNARIKMYQDIMGPNKVSLPRDLSADAVDLMRKLLEKDP